MVDYVLKRDAEGMVRYLYRNDGKHPYVGKTKWESARWMLENDRSRELRMSEEFAEYPLTADGVYFFDGKVEEDGGALSPADAGTSPSADGETGDAVELGADGLPMPAGAEKPRRKKRDERPTEGRTEGASADGEAARRARNSPRSEATGARRIKDVVCE